MFADFFSDLRSAYLEGEPIVVRDLPNTVSIVRARSAVGDVYEARVDDGVATLEDLPTGTHVLEATTDEDDVVYEEFFSIRQFQGEDPVMAFVTSFDADSRVSVLKWLRRLRCTVVQVYDWMANYSVPLAGENEYADPLGRPIALKDLEGLVAGIRHQGAVAQAYAPVIAADENLAKVHPDWRLFRNDAKAQSLGDLLQIMDPGSEPWQQHWTEHYGEAADRLGFDGFHLDTYGYPRAALSSDGSVISVERGYVDFVAAVRRARPRDLLSFNQVNGVPRGFSLPPSPSFRYVEVWPPNDKWRHLEGLIARSAGDQGRHGDTLSIYPPVWGEDRSSALRTCVLSEAVVTMLGANILIWGDDHGVLSHPYYVNHEQLLEYEVDLALTWHRFSLRCRDLFRNLTDTSWYELGDENGAVSVNWNGKVAPEPLGDSLFVRVMRSDDLIVVGLLDLSGSFDGSWSEGTKPGRCRSADVSLLVENPDQWIGEISSLGFDNGRFRTLSMNKVELREGVGLRCTADVDGGWAVLRLRRGSRHLLNQEK